MLIHRGNIDKVKDKVWQKIIIVHIRRICCFMQLIPHMWSAVFRSLGSSHLIKSGIYLLFKPDITKQSFFCVFGVVYCSVVIHWKSVHLR